MDKRQYKIIDETVVRLKNESNRINVIDSYDKGYVAGIDQAAYLLTRLVEQPTVEQCKPPHSIQEIAPLNIPVKDATGNDLNIEDKINEVIEAVNSLLQKGRD